MLIGVRAVDAYVLESARKLIPSLRRLGGKHSAPTALIEHRRPIARRCQNSTKHRARSGGGSRTVPRSDWHAGDGNVHGHPACRIRRKEEAHDIFAPTWNWVARLSEHGIGRPKASWLPQLEGRVRISLMRRIKAELRSGGHPQQALSSETPEHGQEPARTKAGHRPANRPAVSSATSSWTARSASRQSRFPRICRSVRCSVGHRYSSGVYPRC